MDAYFCYIHRPAKPVADLRILACDGDEELDQRLDEMAMDYPSARIEVFCDERLIQVRPRAIPAGSPRRGRASPD